MYYDSDVKRIEPLIHTDSSRDEEEKTDEKYYVDIGLNGEKSPNGG